MLCLSPHRVRNKFLCLGILVSLVPSALSSTLHIFSTYSDPITGEQTRVTGRGIHLSYESQKYGSKEFVVTASHVTGGNNVQIVKRGVKSRTLEEQFHNCKILGRKADFESDLEVFEVSNCSVPFFMDDGRDMGHFITNVAFSDFMQVSIFDNQFFRFFMLFATEREPIFPLYKSIGGVTKNIFGDFITETTVKSGNSGSPLLSQHFMGRYVRSHSMNQSAPGHLMGIAKARWRFFGDGKFVDASKIKPLIESYLANSPAKLPDTIKWERTRGTFHLTMNNDTSDLNILNTLSGNGISADGGNGISADGGNGISADGSNGITNENIQELHKQLGLADQGFSATDDVAFELSQLKKGNIAPGMLYKGKSTLAFVVKTKCNNLPKIYVYASMANLLYIKNHSELFSISGKIGESFNAGSVLSHRFLKTSEVSKKLKFLGIQSNHVLHSKDLYNFREILDSRHIKGSDLRNLFFLDFEEIARPAANLENEFSVNEMCSVVRDGWKRGFVKNVSYQKLERSLSFRTWIEEI